MSRGSRRATPKRTGTRSNEGDIATTESEEATAGSVISERSVGDDTAVMSESGAPTVAVHGEEVDPEPQQEDAVAEPETTEPQGSTRKKRGGTKRPRQPAKEAEATVVECDGDAAEAAHSDAERDVGNSDPEVGARGLKGSRSKKQAGSGPSRRSSSRADAQSSEPQEQAAGSPTEEKSQDGGPDMPVSPREGDAECARIEDEVAPATEREPNPEPDPEGPATEQDGGSGAVEELFAPASSGEEPSTEPAFADVSEETFTRGRALETSEIEGSDALIDDPVGAPDDAQHQDLDVSNEDVTEAAGSTLDSEPPGTLPTGDVSRAHLKGLIEALVFVSDHPMSINEIAKGAGRADRKLVRVLIEELQREYLTRGIHLDEVAGGIVFRTSAVYAPFVREAAARKPVRMSRAQLETLAIVAYRQPLTRPEIDEIRGVDSGPVLKMLLERDLVKILGKKDEPGRPLLYGTTPSFLEFFGLKSLRELPSLREFTELSDESRRTYERKMEEPFQAEVAGAPQVTVPAATEVPGALEPASAPESPSPSDASAALDQEAPQTLQGEGLEALADNVDEDIAAVFEASPEHVEQSEEGGADDDLSEAEREQAEAEVDEEAEVEDQADDDEGDAVGCDDGEEDDEEDDDEEEDEDDDEEDDEDDDEEDDEDDDEPTEGEDNDEPAEGEDNDEPTEGEDNDEPTEGEDNDEPTEGGEGAGKADGDNGAKSSEGDAKEPVESDEETDSGDSD